MIHDSECATCTHSTQHGRCKVACVVCVCVCVCVLCVVYCMLYIAHVATHNARANAHAHAHMYTRISCLHLYLAAGGWRLAVQAAEINYTGDRCWLLGVVLLPGLTAHVARADTHITEKYETQKCPLAS